MDEVLRLEVAALAQSRHLLKLRETNNSEIQKCFVERTFLVTGGTGFLGKQLIEKLLRSCCEIRRIYLLIRPKKGKDVDQRIQDLFSETVFDELRKFFPNFGAKVVAVEGDTSQLGLGLSEKDREMLLKEVDVIIHGAACVRFDDPIKKAILTNARGTREVLFLGAECKNLSAFVYVSTAYAHAPRRECREEFYPSPIPSDLIIEMVETIDEEILQRITPGLIGSWPNTYTFSKAVAEDQVKRLAVQLKIPTAVIRPAIVVAAYREPMPGWVDVSNVFGPSGIPLGLGLGVLHAILADPKCKTDLVPVDMVNNLLLAATYDVFKNEVKQPKIYNFTSTNKNAITWGELSYITKRDGRDFAASKAVWYNFGVMTPNRYIYTIATFLWHAIPACVLDLGATLMGKKPKFRKLYSKMHKLMDVLSYFNLNNWFYHEENVDHLYGSLSATDKDLFNFDISTYKSAEYLLIWYLGIKKYIVKEDLKNRNLALRKQFWFRIGHYVINSLYIYIFWCFLSLLYYIFKFSVVGLSNVL